LVLAYNANDEESLNYVTNLNSELPIHIPRVLMCVKSKEGGPNQNDPRAEQRDINVVGRPIDEIARGL
jgi:hypothetical protein